MPDQGCSEVLRDARALTLRDEPLAGGVEHGPMQLWVTSAQVSISLYDPVYTEVGEQPASLWQCSIQQLLQHSLLAERAE